MIIEGFGDYSSDKVEDLGQGLAKDKEQVYFPYVLYSRQYLNDDSKPKPGFWVSHQELEELYKSIAKAIGHDV
jgi:hypothetical protein